MAGGERAATDAPFIKSVILVRERIEHPDAYPFTLPAVQALDGLALAPIVLAYPGAWIYHLDDTGIARVEYDQTEHVQLTRDFLNGRERFVKRLFADPR